MLRLSSVVAAGSIALLLLTGCGSGGASTAGSPTRAPARTDPVGSSLGVPAPAATDREVRVAVRRYVDALADGDDQLACRYLYGPLAAALPSAAAGSARTGCPAALHGLFAGQSAGARAALRATRVQEVLVRGPDAFAILAGAPRGFYPLRRQARRWKVAALGVSVLPSGARP